MFTLDQTDCSSITSPLSLSLFLASQVTSFSQLRFPHSHHRLVSTRKPILDHPIRSTVHFSPPTRFTHVHTPLKISRSPLKLTHVKKLQKITTCSRHNSAPLSDRLISTAIYTLTLLDGIGYGSHRIPLNLYPRILSQYNSSMLTGVISFYVILLFVIRNPKFRDYVRLNALQALLLGTVLQLPAGILQRVKFPISPVAMMIGYDFMFFLVVFGFIHIMMNIILGKTPQFPLVTEAAGIHLRGL